MSVKQARIFVRKMKVDEAFRKRYLNIKGLNERIDKANKDGYDFTLEEMKKLKDVFIDPKIENNNMPVSWQCKGPCHTKCAPVKG